MRNIKIYKIEELEEGAKNRAISDYKNDSYKREISWQDELSDSFKKLFQIANITIKNYSLGLEQSFVKFDMDENTYKLNSARALAWLESNLLSKLRMSRTKYLANRKDNLKYGYKIGAIPECPLTGTCYDMDFLDSLKKNILEGSNLGDSFKYLANEYSRILDNEYTYQNTDEYIFEHMQANEYEFTESGKRF